jgi:hypothetical protein
MTDPGIPSIPLAEDPGSITRDDAACAIAWQVEPYEVIEVYVDPALSDRADDICGTVEALSGAHRDIDTLSDAIQTFAEAESLSASVYEQPQDAPAGVVAVAFTIG